MADWFSLLRPALYALPPELAHRLALSALSHHLVPSARPLRLPSLAVKAMGLTFPNPIGLAAGFDKNAVAVNALLTQGFGFVEAGTVTPLPQPGNPCPRIFRLVEDEAIINRLGFPGDGLEKFVNRLKAHDRNKGILGANIGRNKDSADAVTDYAAGLKAVYPYADYVAVNVSSPNTPGLRNLQHGAALTQLLAALSKARSECALTHGRKLPLLLKVAPDLEMEEKRDIAEIALAQGVDGLMVSNTTLSRPSLKSRQSSQAGGLSGKPLFSLSTAALKDFYRLTKGKMLLVGVGGVFSAQDAYAKIRAGATLVQLYTAIIYRGFSVVREIEQGLAALLEKDGFASVTEAVGKDA